MGSRDMRPEWATWHRQIPLSDGTSVGCVDVGDGPATLFVHGIFLSSYAWRGVVDQLRADRRCLAPDLLAHGRTVGVSGTELTLQGQATMIVSMLDALDIDQVDLVGNDSGGGVCQIIAALHPERVRSLVLTNCDTHDNWPPVALQPVIDLAKAGAIADVAAAMAADHDIARTDSGFGSGYEDASSLTDDAIEEFVTPFLDRPERVGLLERFLVTIDNGELTSMQSQLGSFAAPTTVVWGTDDVFFTTEWAYWLRDTIPGCNTVIEIEGARLFFPDERADEFTTILRSHLSASER